MVVSSEVLDEIRRSHRAAQVRDDTLWIMINSVSAVVLSTALYLGVVLLPLAPSLLAHTLQLAVLALNTLSLAAYGWRLIGLAPDCRQQQQQQSPGAGQPLPAATPITSTPARRSFSPMSWNMEPNSRDGAAGITGGGDSSFWHSQQSSAGSGSSHSTAPAPAAASRGRRSPEPMECVSANTSAAAGDQLSAGDLSQLLAAGGGGAVAAAATPGHLSPPTEISDLSELDEYMNQYQQHSSTVNSADCSRQSAKLNSSMSLSASPFQPLPNSVYQLSVSVPDMSGDLCGAQQKMEDAAGTVGCLRTWSELGVDHDTLFAWTENLRIWLSKTIFVRVVDEIDAVNTSLRRHGVNDVQIGEAGLDRLRNCAELSVEMTSLKSLLPFLSVTTHQQYLVQRIRKLSEGGCLNDYRWNGGGSFNGQPWKEHLPTDSAITAHLLTVYLDARLPALPSHPTGRTFSEDHTWRNSGAHSDSPTAGAETASGGPTLRYEQLDPPHFSVGHGSRVLSLAKGRNNLFHAVLLFIYLLHRHFDGRLGKVHIGPSGLNILWIIQCPSVGK